DNVRQIEDILKKEEEQRQRNEYARRLRVEGEQLQRAGRIQEAIAKYRESLRYQPDAALEKHIRELELSMVRPTPTPQPTPTPRPPEVTASINLTGSWIGRCEGQSSQYSIEIRHNGNNFTARSEYDEYSGTITGNQIRGKSKTGDDIMGAIINNNQIKITIAYKNISYNPQKCDLQRMDNLQSPKPDKDRTESQRQTYYQVNFRKQFNHERMEGPWSYEGIPLLGYQGMPAPIVWLTKCKAPNNDGICYPMQFEWDVENFTASSLYLLTDLAWWGNNLQNKVIARLTVIGVGGQAKSFDIRAGIHTAEWSGGDIKDNPPLVKIVHPQNVKYSGRRFLNKFELGKMTVTKIKMELLELPTVGGNGVMEISAITLVQ
ncbi:MAG: hypothetical protein N3A62_10130, partial [Thermodesulfovibrionales bacterium]|nr:hypothetical protein [Thermodesulfovibrionales bacterium]